MKAHVVKGNVFAVVFLLAARFREAVAGAAGWAIVFFASPSCGSCSSSLVGSRSCFVVNHVFAVVSGMSLCESAAAFTLERWWPNTLRSGVRQGASPAGAARSAIPRG
jgi:hypothetical protein